MDETEGSQTTDWYQKEDGRRDRHGKPQVGRDGEEGPLQKRKKEKKQ
jgi:hypothetical protein